MHIIKEAAALILACVFFVAAQTVVLTQAPASFQFFARDNQDSGTVVITGKVAGTGYDSMSAVVLKSGSVLSRTLVHLTYTGDTAAFSLTLKIHAEKSEYACKLYGNTDSVFQADSLVCGDAFLIDGQSNALTYGAMPPDARCEWIRSFESAPDYAWAGWGIARAGNVAGPGVGVWGWYVAKGVVDSAGIPVCVLNGAVGATGIDQHLKGTDIYNTLFSRALRSGLNDKIKAIMWYQGENEGNSPAYSAYTANFTALRSSWKTDYPAVSKIYIFQIRPVCGYAYGTKIREILRGLPDLFPDVEIMASNGVGGNDGVHFSSWGYKQMGQWLYPLVAHDFYGSADTVYMRPPNIKNAYFTTPDKNEIALLFDQPIQWTAEMSSASYFDSLNIAFQVGSNPSLVAAVSAVPSQNMILLHLSQPTDASTVTYLPDLCRTNPTNTFQGPWLINPRGIGALSFDALPIEPFSGTAPVFPEGAVLDSMRFPMRTENLLASDSLGIYDSLHLSLTGYYHTADSAFTWPIDSNINASSDSTAVAAISGDWVKALKPGGPVNVTVQQEGKSDTLKLNVLNKPAFIKRINFSDLTMEEYRRWTKPGWESEMTGSYSAARGFGWTSVLRNVDASHDATIGPSVMKTYVTPDSGLWGYRYNTWADYRVDAPDGDYLLRLGVGTQVWANTPESRTNDIVISDGDTLVDKEFGFCQAISREITLHGGNGITLHLRGSIDYIVLISADGARYFNLFADDSLSGGTVLHTVADKKGVSCRKPLLFALPNPFNPSTTIHFTAPAGIQSTCAIYDGLGRQIRQWRILGAGDGCLVWDGRDSHGKETGSGFYTVRLQNSRNLQTIRMIKLK